MIKYSRIIALLLLIVMNSGAGLKRIDYREGMNKNVCKSLRGDALVFIIFVDTKQTLPWTEFDISSTIDSTEKAVIWIEEKARENNVELNLVTDTYIGEYATVKKNLPYGTIKESISTPNLRKGIQSLNKWADKIARTVGSEVNIPEKDGIPDIKNPKDKERLVAYLRDKYQVESVVLLYMLNNYYKSDISVPINHLKSNDVEFSIVSYKYPSVIAQNILCLFGAAKLSESVYRRSGKKIQMASEAFENDIMQDVYAESINQLEIGEYTKYLLGWKEKLDSKYHDFLTDKILFY